MNDDARQIEAACEGDARAFELLVRKYQGRLFNTMLHVTGSHEEAEDVVQDAFIQAFVKLDTFRRESAFYTWLYRIGFNVAISRKRRHRFEDSVERNRELKGEEPVDDGEPPGERLLREERIGQVHAALEALGEDHRAILVLREMEGCDYETIADILQLPVGTVRSRLHRARLQLREQLEDLLQEHPADG
ncbi:MAG: sigma-70 family RNA polymerase sigma factor [Pirellulaceae bacterium]|nr:sigma-70 family RNA polymerase sigma factor [Pirellulaceae bacterium]